MPLQPSEIEILLRLFYERHKHVFLVLTILIILLAAFTFFQIRDKFLSSKTLNTICYIIIAYATKI